MNFLLMLIQAITIPAVILNTAGGIVAIIWLIVLGKWSALFYGLALTVGSTFFIGIAMMPNLILAAPALWAAGKGKSTLAIALGLIPVSYTYILMTAWAMFSFLTFMKKADDASYIPLLLLSYMVASGPWSYMASKEDNPASAISSIFCSLSCMLVMVALYFFNPSLLETIELFSAPLVAALFVNTYFSYKIEEEESLYRM